MVAGWKQYEEFDAPVKKGVDDVSSPESFPDFERPPLRKIDQYVRAEIPYISKRLTVSLLACCGFIIMFGMRESMGMVKTVLNNTSSAVDSAVFWGYFVTQIPGGLIAAAYPANKLFGAAIVSSCLLNFLVPVVYGSDIILIIIRVCQGLVEGVTYPACHGIMRYWAPPLERSRLATIAFSGCYAGVMISMPVCGALLGISHFAPFYFYSVVGIIWYLSWLWLVFEKPSLHTCIDAKELMYIENALGGAQQSIEKPNIRNTPWKSFFTSLPCYAIFVANFCRSWNFYLLVLFQASYFKDAFKSSLAENAILGPLPHLLMTIVVPTGGILADRLRKKGILNTTQVRKLFNCGGFGMEATCFILMAYSDDLMQGVTALTIGVAFSGFAISGFNVNHLDIAPRYASILMGLSNGIGTLAGSFVTEVEHSVVKNHTREEWRLVIIISAMVHYAGVIFYAIFASGELQPWADPSLNEEKQWNPMNESIRKKPSLPGNGTLLHQASGDNKATYGAMETQLPARPPPPRQLSGPATSAPMHIPTGSQQFVGDSQEFPTNFENAPVYPEEHPNSSQVPAVPIGNPFRSSSTNPFRQETVQPAPQDIYMHGSIEDRTY